MCKLVCSLMCQLLYQLVCGVSIGVLVVSIGVSVGVSVGVGASGSLAHAAVATTTTAARTAITLLNRVAIGGYYTQAVIIQHVREGNPN